MAKNTEGDDQRFGLLGEFQINKCTDSFQVSDGNIKHILFNQYFHFSLVEHNKTTERNTPTLSRCTNDSMRREISHSQEEQILHSGLLN